MYRTSNFGGKMKRILLLGAALGISLNLSASDTINLKNGREIYATYASIMGLDGRIQELRESYLNNADRLPKAGTPDELSNPAVLGTIELGGTFCKQSLMKEVPMAHGQR